MPPVNPEILVWARNTAGLTIEGAAAKVGIRDARGAKAVDRLAALERGDEEPTRAVVVRMAKHYRRPLLTFYLAAHPRQCERGVDFRRLPVTPPREAMAIVDALVRDMLGRQDMVRAALEEEDEAEPLPFLGALSECVGIAPGGESLSIESWSELTRSVPPVLAQVLGRDLNAAKYQAQPTAREAFDLLRSQTEKAGVFVILQGDLGSYHTAIELEFFRGFVIADNVAPFVIINDKDSPAAWSFTLVHELMHLLLGQTGICGARPGTDVERLCNHIASDWMLPASTLDRIEIDRYGRLTEVQQRIDEFANPRNLSRNMVAWRLLRAERIDRHTFDRLRAKCRKQRQLQRRRNKTSAAKRDPDDYAVQRRLGQALIGFTSRMMASGSLSATKAAKVLGVEPTRVGKVLDQARS